MACTTLITLNVQGLCNQGKRSVLFYGSIVSKRILSVYKRPTCYHRVSSRCGSNQKVIMAVTYRTTPFCHPLVLLVVLAWQFYSSLVSPFFRTLLMTLAAFKWPHSLKTEPSFKFFLSTVQIVRSKRTIFSRPPPVYWYLSLPFSYWRLQWQRGWYWHFSVFPLWPFLRVSSFKASSCIWTGSWHMEVQHISFVRGSLFDPSSWLLAFLAIKTGFFRIHWFVVGRG